MKTTPQNLNNLCLIAQAFDQLCSVKGFNIGFHQRLYDRV